MRFVSSIRLCGVPVNLGGAWGGFRYFSGAMETLVSGRWLVYLGTAYCGSWKWLSRFLTRAPKREEARTKVMEAKRMRLVTRSLTFGFAVVMGQGWGWRVSQPQIGVGG